MKRNKYIFILLVGFTSILVMWWWSATRPAEAPLVVVEEQEFDDPGTLETPAPFDDMPTWVPPLEGAKERVTKKPFGILIDPKTSPIQPERYRGYHTGVDFEVFADEVNETLTVSAVCAGEIVVKRRASGYGGVVVQRCTYAGETLSVIYGHLALSSVMAKVGDELVPGEPIGALGESGSRDTDGERKHLHLGLYRGDSPDIRGYVATQAELSRWIDPCLLVCR